MTTTPEDNSSDVLAKILATVITMQQSITELTTQLATDMKYINAVENRMNNLELAVSQLSGQIRYLSQHAGILEATITSGFAEIRARLK